MINVYSWPPVSVLESEWTMEAPVQKSTSLLTGRDYVSAHGRKRRLATMTVSALSGDRSGAGYVEMLKRFLDGGVHAVRLYSKPINWWMDSIRKGEVVFSGNAVRLQDGRYRISATGLPNNRLIARSGEFLSASGTISQIVRNVFSDSNGTASIDVFDEIPLGVVTDGRIGVSDTGVFRVLEMPRAVQPMEGNWMYTFEFREVFEDETGGFLEVDPWND